MSESVNGLAKKIKEYKKKFYLNLILKGSIITASIILTFFLAANLVEYVGRFSSIIRGLIFFAFVISSIGLLVYFILIPLFKSNDPENGLRDEDAARMIGGFFPEIRDKLLNIIQLQKMNNGKNQLVSASINQKSGNLRNFTFATAINLGHNRKYLRYLVPPAIIALILAVVLPNLFSTSTQRIVQFSREFIPAAPFQFVIDSQKLLAFKNEDFTIELTLTGEAFPENVYLVNNGRKMKMNRLNASSFEFTFQKIQAEKSFYFESAGFTSFEFELKIASRPNLKSFDVHINYPSYLGKDPERFSNVGNLQIPEGSIVTWQFQTLEAMELQVDFKDSKNDILFQNLDNQFVEAKKQFFKSEEYEIKLRNKFSENLQKINYSVSVIPDQYPEINLNIFQDTVLYSFLILGGYLEDDYGLSRLGLFYEIERNNNKSDWQSIPIPLVSHQNNQSFYYEWTLGDMNIKEGEKINYYLQVWDNDGVNGAKSTKTGTYTFMIPTRDEIKKEIEAATSKSEDKIEETLKQTEDLRKKLEEAENRLRGKKDMDWQDENLLNEILQKKHELEEALKKLSEENKANDLKRQRFDEENARIREKVEQLQKLMDDLLDEETRKLYEELQKLLEEKEASEEMQKLINRINQKENNLEKELERTLELFKKMKFEYKLNETIHELEELAEEQEELARKTGEDKVGEEEMEQKSEEGKQEEGSQQEENSVNQEAEEKDSQNSGENEGENENLTGQQEELNTDFEQIKENIEEIQDLNQNLKNPQSMQDFNDEQQQIQENQQKSLENLKQNQNKKAQDSQKKAAQQMKQLSQKLQEMQGGMEMETMTENMENLRDILHNLLQLSFDQEKLMNDFREINQSDPRFVEFSQQQLKIKDESKIVKDSLLSLASRVFQIQSFVTREVSEMNRYIDEAMEALRDRGRNVIPVTTGKQQFAMTSMNNLALMLDDVLQQMQQAMSEAMGNPQKGKGNQRMPGMTELQQQLNQQIQQLKESGKSGRELSEELAKLAAEQERIRRALQEAEEKLNQGQGQGELQELMNQMEETELDLVNKHLTEETIERQNEILTRLLDAENSIRERDLDDEREAETAKSYENLVPKAFEDYFKLKEKEVELLKTVPLKLFPYYKKEVNEYFKRIGEN
ncbi:MAG TPA: DUF4175 family protein [Cyclobacteriaceae bacterium]|jgi:hypothetical protein